jgi:hypothetical protein
MRQGGRDSATAVKFGAAEPDRRVLVKYLIF